VPTNNIRAEGKIRNVNTIEDFTNTDKASMLKIAGKQVMFSFNTKWKFLLNDLDMGCY